MNKLLVLNENSSIAAEVIHLFNGDDSVNVVEYTTDFKSGLGYQSVLENVDWIFAAVGPHDVDLEFEQLFAAIDKVNPPIKHFIMLVPAGIDGELAKSIEYPGVSDTEEYFKEQRYAIKIVDEFEIPYTVFRVGKVFSGNAQAIQLINEGQSMPVSPVTSGSVAVAIHRAFTEHGLIDKSVGIVNK